MPKPLNNNIQHLSEHQIAGAATINPIVDFIINMHTLSPDLLWINPDGRGSVSFDLNVQGLSSIIGGVIRLDGGGIDFDFKAKIANDTLTVQSGNIYLPDRMVTAAALSRTITALDSGKMVYVRMTSANAAEIVLDDAVTHTLQTGGGNYRVTLPIATITYANSTWAVHYYHLGAFAITQEPYFYIAGYNRAVAQSLDHAANGDGLAWHTYGVCP